VVGMHGVRRRAEMHGRRRRMGMVDGVAVVGMMGGHEPSRRGRASFNRGIGDLRLRDVQLPSRASAGVFCFISLCLVGFG
jgi:hypothetical protein